MSWRGCPTCKKLGGANGSGAVSIGVAEQLTDPAQTNDEGLTGVQILTKAMVDEDSSTRNPCAEDIVKAITLAGTDKSEPQPDDYPYYQFFAALDEETNPISQVIIAMLKKLLREDPDPQYISRSYGVVNLNSGVLQCSSDPTRDSDNIISPPVQMFIEYLYNTVQPTQAIPHSILSAGPINELYFRFPHIDLSEAFHAYNEAKSAIPDKILFTFDESIVDYEDKITSCLGDLVAGEVEYKEVEKDPETTIMCYVKPCVTKGKITLRMHTQGNALEVSQGEFSYVHNYYYTDAECTTPVADFTDRVTATLKSDFNYDGNPSDGGVHNYIILPGSEKVDPISVSEAMEEMEIEKKPIKKPVKKHPKLTPKGSTMKKK